MDPITASAAISTVLGKAADIIGRFIPDPAQKAQAALEVMRLQDSAEARNLAAMVTSDQGQIEVNKIEAMSAGIYKGGWRPGAGWVCVFALAYQMLFRPLFGWVATNVWAWSMPPSLEIESLMTMLFGMLGLGVYRMNEKIKGVA